MLRLLKGLLARLAPSSDESIDHRPPYREQLTHDRHPGTILS